MSEDIRTEGVSRDTKKSLPKDYHCGCKFCKKFMGVLKRPDGSYYNKNDRRKYYSKGEIASTKEISGHIAKTPLHVARWAIQEFTKENDWVFDPTAGAGTTLVEALNHGRNAAGIEIQFIDVIRENVAANNPCKKKSKIWHGDARDTGKYLKKFKKEFSLIVNNPPYSGDVSQKGLGDHRTYDYEKGLKNLAFLKEGEEYYKTIRDIYAQGVEFLKPGGHLVIGVKDMIKNKVPYMLHRHLTEAILEIPGLKYVGTSLLPHYPTTLFMNTYNKRFPDVKVPMYQTITVFKKEGK